MIRRAVIRCAWDPEAEVWSVRETDIPGLVTESATLDALRAKLPDLARDLLDMDAALAVDLSVETRGEVMPPSVESEAEAGLARGF